MKIILKLKEIINHNLAIFIFYFLSFTTFEGAQEYPNILIFSNRIK